MDSIHSRHHRNTAGFLRVLAFFTALSVVAQPPQPSASVHPDFDGAWSSATAIPLERPAWLKDQPFYTPEQAAELQRKTRGADEDPLSRLERGSLMLPSLRTSIITAPANGRFPSLTPSAAAARRDRLERLHNPAAAIDMGLQDRCLVFPTSVPPMIPYGYNSNYQIVQTGDAVVVQAEMIHDARIIRLDRAHLPSNVRQWLGDSVGHWEGATLVVDTTNFNDANGFYGDAGGMYGWDRNMHVVERFSLLDANTILYRFEVEDPTAYTEPWKGELTMTRVSNPPFEYACQEGNRDLRKSRNTLVQEREAIKGSWAQVDAALQRRADLIPNLVETVKRFAKQEQAVIKSVTDARAALGGAQTPSDKIQANSRLDGALSRLLVVVENYPQLRSNENFMRLQDELSGTENHISVDRRKYNEVVQRYNTDIALFPNNIAASLYGFQREDAYFKTTPGAEKVPSVKF